MGATVEQFRLRFPEFSDETEFPDARIQMFIDDTICIMGEDENYWCCYATTQCYLAAHLLAVASATEAGSAGSSAGPIVGKTAGGVSVTRGHSGNNRSDGDDWYMSTSYGQRYLADRNRCIIGAMVIC